MKDTFSRRGRSIACWLLSARCSVVIQHESERQATHSGVVGGHLKDRNTILQKYVNDTVMSENEKRNRLIQARLTPAEYDRIHKKFKKTTCRKLSDYMRKVLLDKAVTVNMRNQSLDDFMAEMIVLRNELNAIGNNYNQLIKKLHSMGQVSEIKTWLILNESARKILLTKVEQIHLKIAQFNDVWLHE